MKPHATPRPVRYRIEHVTRYTYTVPVAQSWQLARLTPRHLPWQKTLSHALTIDPAPDERHDEPDSFDNTVTHFGLHAAHKALQVKMQCLVEVGARPASSAEGGLDRGAERDIDAGHARTWSAVRDIVRRDAAHLAAARVSEPTQQLPLSAAAGAYAAASFPAGQEWLVGVTDLMNRIHADFAFEPGATTVGTSVDEVLAQRRGVCQDFAHLMLSCLRSLGLPARYVSGYLLTDPPPGQTRMIGADASHAWVAAYSPSHGWVEFDPTNRQLADSRYTTLAWGADFADVVPLRGVILGGGPQTMSVRVSVIPQD